MGRRGRRLLRRYLRWRHRARWRRVAPCVTRRPQPPARPAAKPFATASYYSCCPPLAYLSASSVSSIVVEIRPDRALNPHGSLPQLDTASAVSTPSKQYDL